MRKYIIIAVAGVILCSLLLAGVALAMDSDNYSLDWFTPCTGGGGGESDSANYAVNLTIGQTADGESSSDSYRACLGYWCGMLGSRVYLPVILRN
ncbi:MAG: hypothetical protein JW908_02365 [Anaerolineales bacterium]|nr:hypothetical protein [Anaerolineales bacterium]